MLTALLDSDENSMASSSANDSTLPDSCGTSSVDGLLRREMEVGRLGDVEAMDELSDATAKESAEPLEEIAWRCRLPLQQRDRN